MFEAETIELPSFFGGRFAVLMRCILQRIAAFETSQVHAMDRQMEHVYTKTYLSSNGDIRVHYLQGSPTSHKEGP